MKEKLLIGLIMIISLVFIDLGKGKTLENYIKIGLKNNIAFQQKDLDLQKSIYALIEAKRMYLPSILINARYTRAGGGRVIDFPIGDMLNPIHSSLNSLLAAQGQLPRFSTNLGNQSIPFLRSEEHDTKLRIIQPVFNAPLLLNIKIKSHLKNIRELLKRMYQRQLIYEIEEAYYNYLKTCEVINIYTQIRNLVLENLNTSKSLFKRGVRTEDVVFRAESEMSGLDEKILEAKKDKILAGSYFNFLLNRPLSEEIKIEESDLFQISNIKMDKIMDHALLMREEILLYKIQILCSQKIVNLERGKLLPNVAAIFDYGYQGEKYLFNKDHDYWIASLNFEWKLFNGLARKSKINQEQINLKKAELQFSELQQKIRLQIKRVYENLYISISSIKAGEKRLITAEKSYLIISKKYKSGMVSLLELLDAQTNLKSAKINLMIKQYDFFIKYSKFKYISAMNGKEISKNFGGIK